MGIDREKFRSPADRGAVSGVAINCVIGFGAVIRALHEIKRGGDTTESIKKLEETVKSLDELFAELTGWTPGL